MKRLMAVVMMGMFLFAGASVMSAKASPYNGDGGQSSPVNAPQVWRTASRTVSEQCALNATGHWMTREELKEMQYELAHGVASLYPALSAEQAACALVSLPNASGAID